MRFSTSGILHEHEWCRGCEKIGFGAKLTFHRDDPYSEQKLGTDAVPSGSKRFRDANGKLYIWFRARTNGMGPVVFV